MSESIKHLKVPPEHKRKDERGQKNLIKILGLTSTIK